MKQTLLAILFTTYSTCMLAQVPAKEKPQEKSNAEIFSNKAGTLIQKEFETIGKLKGCEIQVVRFSDMISGQKNIALRFEYQTGSGYSSDTKLAILDADEVTGLINSIKLIKDKVLPTIPTNYTEVTFRSRSGFEAGCFSDKSKWSTYIKLERYDSKSFIFLDNDTLDMLLQHLELAKPKLI